MGGRILPGLVHGQLVDLHPAGCVQPVQQPGMHGGPVDPGALVSPDHRDRPGPVVEQVAERHAER